MALFGGERMITECCRPASSRQVRQGLAAPSDPGMDTLISNIAVWAAHYGTKVGG